jgi:transcriptional regulator of NAD metabolism
MHQIICGEIPKKVKVKNRDEIENFISNIENDYKNFYSMKNCLYQNKILISDPLLNFLNKSMDKNLNSVLKTLIRYEFDECEKVYPYLGNLFLEYYFKDEILNKDFESFKFHYDDLEEFINSIQDEIVKNIATWFFDNCSLDHFVSVEKTKGNDIILEKYEKISFDLEYDSDYLGKKNSHTVNDYKFIIIDGMIDTIGEIHHLLMNASETKEPHVIFCFGVSDEVKSVIIENNLRGITEVFPVSLKFDEDTINILNDIAIIHNSEIITALKGQTISQATRRVLSKGKKLTFMKNNIVIDPICSKQNIQSHKNFLFKRMKNSVNEKNIELISKRIKRLNTKVIKISVPEYQLKNNSFVRELDYFLRFLNSISRPMIKMSINDKNIFYYLPVFCIELVKNKKQSLKNTFSNMEKVILLNKGE